jgi:hypothetical protein
LTPHRVSLPDTCFAQKLFCHQFVILGNWSKRPLNCSPGFPYEIMVVVAVVCFAFILITTNIVVIFDAVVTKSLC